MISGSEIKVLDKNSEYYGVSARQLMEKAGKGVADFIIKHLKPEKKGILVFCGTGNNGGDGFVAARYLASKYNITLFLVGKEKDIKTELSKNNFKKLKKMTLEIYCIDTLNKIDKLLSENSIIVDSMLGIGLSGSLREPYYVIVKQINAAENKTIIPIIIIYS